MSLKYIQALSMNPHFFALLSQGFLSGYKKPCEVRLLFMALPILLYAESRKKLSKAVSRSTMESLFNKQQDVENRIKVSGKVNLAGYLHRFEELKPFSKKALVILYSEKKISLKETQVTLLKPIEYSQFEGITREWLKAAHYLGLVFAKTNEDHLNYFLGVDRQ